MRATLLALAAVAVGCASRLEPTTVDVVRPAPVPPAAPPAAPTLTSGRIVALADGGALVIDADSGLLVRTDRSGAAAAQLAIGHDAGHLAYDPAADLGFVADRDGDRVVVVDVGRMAPVAEWRTPAEPFGVALTPDRATVLVTTVADRTLVAFDAGSGAEQWRAALGAEPRGLAIAPDGSRALIASIGRGELDDVALAGAHPVTRIAFDLDCDRCQSGDMVARGTGAVMFLDPQRAVASFQREVPEASFARGDRYGGGSFFPPVSHHLAFFTFEVAGAPPTAQTVAQIAEHQPRALAWDAGGDALLVAGLGSDTVLHLPGLTRGTKDGIEGQASSAMLQVAARCGPDGIAITRERDALVWCGFSRSILRVSGLAGGGRFADDARVSAGPTLAASSWTELEHDGHVLFHVSRAAIHADGALACATCHPEGRADGLTWHIGGRRHQTPMLGGRLAGTAPYKWDGSDPTLAASLATTARRLHGRELDAGQIAALSAYLEALPPPRPPTRDPAAVARGRLLFEGELACATCHEGPRYTDGDRHTFDRNPAYDTPSLIGLAASAPYFHDGSAETLDDLLRGYGTARGMADFDALSPADRADLRAFLETL